MIPNFDALALTMASESFDGSRERIFFVSLMAKVIGVDAQR
jgi:hypothetical protein